MNPTNTHICELHGKDLKCRGNYILFHSSYIELSIHIKLKTPSTSTNSTHTKFLTDTNMACNIRKSEINQLPIIVTNKIPHLYYYLPTKLPEVGWRRNAYLAFLHIHLLLTFKLPFVITSYG